jgi:drug/metabolite transporter (DMT)-like permease
MALSALLFAFMGFFARLASGSIHWSMIGFTRAVVGLVVALGVARARRAPMLVRDRRDIWLRSVFGTGSMIFTFSALSSPALALGDTTTLLNLSPVFMAGLSPLVLGERPGRRLIAALPISLAGVVLILHPPFLFGGAHLGGDALRTALTAVAAALTSAGAMMMIRRIGQREGPEAIAIHFSAFAAAVLFLVGLPFLSMPRAADVGWVLLAGVCGGVAQLAMTRAYALEPAANVGSMGYLGVVVSALLGAIVLHEWPTASAIAGMGLVIAGGLVIALRLQAPGYGLRHPSTPRATEDKSVAPEA